MKSTTPAPARRSYKEALFLLAHPILDAFAFRWWEHVIHHLKSVALVQKRSGSGVKPEAVVWFTVHKWVLGSSVCAFFLLLYDYIETKTPISMSRHFQNTDK
jgi:hypothetical protein